MCVDRDTRCSTVVGSSTNKTQQPLFEQINPMEYLDSHEMGTSQIPLTRLLGFSENYLLTSLGQWNNTGENMDR